MATLEVVDGGLEVSEASGVTRVNAAMASRGGQLEALTLRDRVESPQLELAIAQGSQASRLSLMVRWLDAPAEGLSARASYSGRLVAETDLCEGSALLENLRLADLRIDIVRADRTIGVAWLQLSGKAGP